MTLPKDKSGAESGSYEVPITPHKRLGILPTFKHGLRAYHYHKCRCEICKLAKHESNQRYQHPMGSRQRCQYCPACPLAFYTDAAFKQHWKEKHAGGAK